MSRQTEDKARLLRTRWRIKLAKKEISSIERALKKQVQRPRAAPPTFAKRGRYAANFIQYLESLGYIVNEEKDKDNNWRTYVSISREYDPIMEKDYSREAHRTS